MCKDELYSISQVMGRNHDDFFLASDQSIIMHLPTDHITEDEIEE